MVRILYNDCNTIGEGYMKKFDKIYREVINFFEEINITEAFMALKASQKALEDVRKAGRILLREERRERVRI